MISAARDINVVGYDAIVEGGEEYAKGHASYLVQSIVRLTSLGNCTYLKLFQKLWYFLSKIIP